MADARQSGTDGIHIWNVETRQLTYWNHGELGTVSCVIWVKTKHSAAETICYGTGRGYLIFLRPNPLDVRLAWIPGQYG